MHKTPLTGEAKFTLFMLRFLSVWLVIGTMLWMFDNARHHVTDCSNPTAQHGTTQQEEP